VEQVEDNLANLVEDVSVKELNKWKRAVEKAIRANKDTCQTNRKRVDDTRAEVAKHLVKVGGCVPHGLNSPCAHPSPLCGASLEAD